MLGFIQFKELLSFGVSEDTLKKSCMRFRQQKSLSWRNFKLNGLVYVELESIPKKTRENYGIPNSHEWEKIQKERKKQEKQEEARRNADINYQKLNNAVVGWSNFMDHYINLLDKKGVTGKIAVSRARKFSMRHAFFKEAINILPRKNMVGTKDVHNIGIELTKKYTQLAIKENFAHFSSTLSKVRELGIESVVFSGLNNDNFKPTRPKNNQKFGDYERALVAQYSAHGSKYTHVQVERLVNSQLKKENKPLVSLSWVKSIRNSPEFKNLVEFQNKGVKGNEESILKYVHRLSHPYANAVWQIDGTPSQTMCWENGKWIRPYMVAVMDAYTKKIIGLSISKSEDRNAILTALQTAVDSTGQLPNELVMDNASAFKTDEFKEIIFQLENKGVVCRSSDVGNAKDKSQIERFWNTFQGKYEPMLLNFIGRGITTNPKKRPSQAHIQANLKQSKYCLNDMKGHLSQLVAMYNSEKIDKISPNELYNNSNQNPNRIEIDLLTQVMLFFYTTKVKVSRGEIKITYKKQNYFFDVPIAENLKIHGTQVVVKYDPSDLSSIWVFNKDNEFVCECKEIKPVSNLAANRTEEENKQILRVSAKNKSITDKAIKKYNDLIAPLAGMELGTLYDTYKDSINDAESQNFINIINMRNDFIPDIARPLGEKGKHNEFVKSDYEMQRDLISKKRK